MQQGSTPSPSDHGKHQGTNRKHPNHEASTRAFHDALRKNDDATQPAALSRLLFWRQAKTSRGQRALRIVWAVLSFQFIVSMFIIGHELLELQGFRSLFGDRTVFAMGLLLSAFVLVSLYTVNILLREIRSADTSRAVATGALARLLDVHFDEWKLTAAERDVALFTLKGFETSEIAGFRSATQGTIRVQLAQIYGKVGVHSRGAFQSLFLEDLLDLSETHAADLMAAGA